MRRLLVAAALTVVVVLTAVSPAGASEVTGSFDSPTAGATLTATTARVAGSFNHAGGAVREVRLTLRSLRAGEAADPKTRTITGNSETMTFRWDVDLLWGDPTVSWNGEYVATAQASGDHPVVPGSHTSQTIERRFFVEVAPVAPGGVDARFASANRTVKVTWLPNPEPDLLGYVVQRDIGSGFEGLENGFVPAGDDPSYVDDVGEGSGTYRYQVVAVREGRHDFDATAAAPQEGINSTPSSAASASVPPPPTTTTTGTPSTSAPSSTASGGAGSTPTTTKAPALARQGKVDLSRFSSLLDQARRPARPASRPAEPDTGFDENLPYAPRTTEAEPVEEVEDEPLVAIQEEEDLGGVDDERLRQMKVLAGGLLAFVVFMHLWWLRGEVDRAPLDPLEPSDHDRARDENEGRADAGDADGRAEDLEPVLVGASVGASGGTGDGEPRARLGADAAEERSPSARGAARRVPPRSRGARREGGAAVRPRR